MNEKNQLTLKAILQIEYLKLKYGANFEFRDTKEGKINTDKATQWANNIVKQFINHLN